MQRPPVLLIEEDESLARFIAKDIDALGYQVFMATSVGDALRLIAERPYSAIVADYMGPRRQFWRRWPILQLCARFASRTPVLALSMFKDIPRGGNLLAVVLLPDYTDDLANGLKRHALAVPEETPEPFLARYLAALWDANEGEAAGVVQESMNSGWGGGEVYEDLIAAALYVLGDWWGDKACTVADEHGARVITERLMARVSARVKARPPRARSIVIACVRGERHELGARMAADLFAWDGWTVRLLGADTPLADLIDEVRRRQPEVVGLAATMPPNSRSIASLISRVRAAGTDIVLVGGQAFRSLDREVIGALGAARADSAQSAVELANRLVQV